MKYTSYIPLTFTNSLTSAGYLLILSSTIITFDFLPTSSFAQ
nr:MAG TPA: hypothetical protein [Caudoviricetes sp.]